MTASLPGGAAPARLLRWLATWLLLFNVVAGGVLPDMANARETSLSDLSGSMVVCTAAGMVVVDHDTQSKGTAGDHSYVCAFCLPLMHGGAAIAAPMALSVSLLPMPLVLTWPDGPRLARGILFTGSIAPRAPPTFI